jgi:hypothetical protein
MLNMKDLRQKAVTRGFQLMSNPRVQKVMSNPRVMGTLMKAFELRTKMDAAKNARLAAFAKRMNLATAADVGALKRNIADLESKLAASTKQ